MYFCIQGKGFTALRVASAHGQTEVTHTLLDRGATVDYQDKVHACLIDYNVVHTITVTLFGSWPSVVSTGIILY